MNRQQGSISLQTILALVGLAALAWVFGPSLLQWAQAQGSGETAVTIGDGAAIIQPVQPIQPIQRPLVMATPTLAPNAPEARPAVSAAALTNLDQVIGKAAQALADCRLAQAVDPYNNYRCEVPQDALTRLQAQRAELVGN